MITVDPGLGGTGLAAWRDDESVPYNTKKLTVPTKVGDWVARSEQYSIDFQNYLKLHWEVEEVWIEFPGLHTTASGMASAQSGDIFKLTFLVGIYACHAWNYGMAARPLPVNDWKGTLSKDAIEFRVRRVLGDSLTDSYPNHVLDAVGMGLHLKGLLNETGARRPK